MKKIVVIAGAGISVNSPSCLPSWWSYNKKLIELIKKNALELCPEAGRLLDIIDVERDLPVQCISDIIVRQGAGSSYFPLLELLNASRPNANHLALTKLARNGILKAIITTNFDTLIETAFRQEGVNLLTIVSDETYYETAQSQICKLYKIHGSVQDHDSLIDTVSQKSVGLSPAKQMILKQVFNDSNLVFIGFSGADFDFNSDYIPISEAVERGSDITWILRPSAALHPQVSNLATKFGDTFHLLIQELSEYFISNGIDYVNLQIHCESKKEINPPLPKFDEKINELLKSPHIGTHGCVGYCIYLLRMMGYHAQALEMSSIYEKKIDLKAVDIFSVCGLIALASQKFITGQFDESIRFNIIALQCLSRMNEVSKEYRNKQNVEFSKEQEQRRISENISNLSTVATNIGVSFYYKSDLKNAIVYLEQAKIWAESEKNFGRLAIIGFNLARTYYKMKKDYDKFIIDLKISAEYARKSGQLNYLIDILVEECDTLISIGEYYLAKERLIEFADCLKNVGDFTKQFQLLLLNAQYYMRKGNQLESLETIRKLVYILREKRNTQFAKALLGNVLTMYAYNNEVCSLIDDICGICGEDSETLKNLLSLQSEHQEKNNIKLPVFILETLPEDEWRKLIILCEFEGHYRNLPHLFLEGCTEYAHKGYWGRLEDIANCCYNAALEIHELKIQSIALYYLGCSALENSNFSDAENLFRSITLMNDEASSDHLGWAHIELAKMNILKKDLTTATQDYAKSKKVLISLNDRAEMTKAWMAYAISLFQNGYHEHAILSAKELLDVLTEKDDTKLLNDVSDIINKFILEKDTQASLDIKLSSPQEMATEAIRLHDSGENLDLAWELIAIAKEKYKDNNDQSGIGRCENNMGHFCQSEKRHTEAKEHFEEALRIKNELKDIPGIISEYTNIISVYIVNNDLTGAYDRVKSVEAHLPEYKSYKEVYKLYYTLFLYYSLKANFAESLENAKKAYGGIEYILDPNEKKNAEHIMITFIKLCESAFSGGDLRIEHKKPFDEMMLKAIQLQKKGLFYDCYALLKQISDADTLSNLERGIIEGTYGNAFSDEQRYQEAIDKYHLSRIYFSSVDEPDKYTALQHSITALQGITVALDHLGKSDEAIAILREELSSVELSEYAKYSCMSSLCNRLINKNKEELAVDHELYNEIMGMLKNCLHLAGKDYERKGVTYSIFGSLYVATQELQKAKQYYLLAKKQFITSNSKHITTVDLVLKNIHDALDENA